MWMTTPEDGKYKYTEDYKDPYTGKKRYKSVTLTSQSKQAWNKAKKILDKKIEAAENTKDTKDMTFGQLMEEWYPLHEKPLRNSTKRKQRIMRRKIEETIDVDILVSNIDTRYLQNWINGFDHLSHGYTRSIKILAGQALSYAVDMGIIDHSPMDKVKIIKKNDVTTNISEKYFEPDQAQQLIEKLSMSKRTLRMARLAEFMYLTGCRIGEAIILKKSDFDFEKGTVSFHGTLDATNGYKKAIKGPPKTNTSHREISLTDRCIELVKSRIIEQELESIAGGRDTGYVFSTASGTPIQIVSFNKSLKLAGEKLGMQNSHEFSSHYFRHTHISLLAENNVPLKAIMARVGHSDSKTTTDIYTHVTRKMISDVTSKLDDIGL
ncbi:MULTISPECIES: tyrosine-type recombinase/integrase [unclassified Aerococcus]|uniref:tyrosine-type recombinase/integrase n=1 Tax=unclassified Aerococcus TaxID=2618060 RepID=UPI0025BD57CD|nr:MULTISPECIES: site-specific integrase [unclassified Aerococcus]